MIFRLFILNILVFLSSALAIAQDSLANMNEQGGQVSQNPFKAPQKDFGMFYWGVGIGLLLLLVALIYRWRTRGQQ